MSNEINWPRVVNIITELERAPESEKAIRELAAQLDELHQIFLSADESGSNLVSFLFQQSILPLLNNCDMSPTLLLKILGIFNDLLQKQIKILVSPVEAAQIVAILLKHNLEHKKELFEEIGLISFEILIKLISPEFEISIAAFLITAALDYATKSTIVHGEIALDFLLKTLQCIAPSAKAVTPGVSVAMTTLVHSKYKNGVISRALNVLRWLWTNVELTDEDASKLSDLISRIFNQRLDHPKSRISRIELANELIDKRYEVLKDCISPCVRCIFAGVADENIQVKDKAKPFIEKLGGSLIIAGEFEQCVEDFVRCAKGPDEHKRLNIMQTILGVIEINQNSGSGFDSQILTCLHSLTTALILSSEIQLNDPMMCEIEGGFIVRRHPYLGTALHFHVFTSIIRALPIDSFVEILIDVLNDNSTHAAEIFYIFGIISDIGPTDLMMSILEESQWWTPKEHNPKSVLTLEIVLEVTSKLCGTELLQKLLYRVIECLASQYSSVRQTANAAILKIAPNGDVAKLLMDNVDYITDRLIARLQFVDVSPEVLTVFSAILSVDGDIADLLSHLMPRIYELLDTRDSFSLPILKMFPRVCMKLPSHGEQVIDRSIHFVLSPSISTQCAALDSLISAIPVISNEDKLLPMIHQMWAPSVLIIKSSADPSNSAARRAIQVVDTCLLAARSFVTGRVRELLPDITNLVIKNIEKLRYSPLSTHALKMEIALLNLVADSLDGENIFNCQELEVFNMLLNCFEPDVKPEIKNIALKCLTLLYSQSKAFVWVLMMEAAQKYPQGELPIKKTAYLTPISIDVRHFIANMLSA